MWNSGDFVSYPTSDNLLHWKWLAALGSRFHKFRSSFACNSIIAVVASGSFWKDLTFSQLL